MASKRAFTIIELLVVIVVIGILATITIVFYSNISFRSNTASIQADLKNSSTLIEQYRIGSSTNDTYPSNLSLVNLPSGNANYSYKINENNNNYCLSKSSGNTSIRFISETKQFENTNCDYFGLIGWWRFNGDANDSSDNGLNGTVSGPTLTTGQGGLSNTAYNFTGGSNSIVLPSSSLLNIGKSMTISAWIQPASSLSASSWFHIFAGDSGDWGFGLSTDASSIARPRMTKLNIADATLSTTSLSSLVWYHVALTYGQYSGTYYVNGSTAGTFSFNRDYVSGIKRIGSSTAYGAGFKGVIDDVRLYNNVLTQTEINSLYVGNAQ